MSKGVKLLPKIDKLKLKLVTIEFYNYLEKQKIISNIYNAYNFEDNISYVNIFIKNYIFLNIADNIFGYPLQALFFLIVSSKLLVYIHSNPFS